MAEVTRQIRAMMMVQLARNDRAPVEVVPGVFIGSVAASIFSRGLKEAGITHAIVAVKGIRLLHVSDSINARVRNG